MKPRIAYSTNLPSLTEMQSHKCVNLLQHHLQATRSSSSEQNTIRHYVIRKRCRATKQILGRINIQGDQPCRAERVTATIDTSFDPERRTRVGIRYAWRQTTNHEPISLTHGMQSDQRLASQSKSPLRGELSVAVKLICNANEKKINYDYKKCMEGRSEEDELAVRDEASSRGVDHVRS